MDNKNLLMEKLRSELLQLRRKIEVSDDRLPIELGLPAILLDIENQLNNQMPNKKILEKGAYGIFRLVTESYEFEKSHLGQELLDFREKIKKFASILSE